MRWSYLDLSVGSFNNYKDCKMYSHNHKKTHESLGVFFLHFVQKSPVGENVVSRC